MYLKIDEAALKKIQEITMTDYEAEGSFLPSDAVNDIIEDLLLEIDRLQEKYEDLEQNLEENYKPIPVSEQYGVTNHDFL
jgi:hypothetical protein